MLEAFGLSDPGCVRSNNEDYFISDSASAIFILADGMGGAVAGEFASQLSAERLYQYLLEPSHESPESMEQGFLEANWCVRQAAVDKPELDGMGTTLVVARGLADTPPVSPTEDTADASLGPITFQIASVGDSRAYFHRRGHIQLMTQDQTWVAEVGTRLGLSEEVLKKHPMRHVLTMAVGSTEDLRVFSRIVQLSPGDQILLCSDGLHGVLHENTLLEALDSEKSLPEKCHYLVDAAKSEGGPDNVTVVLIQLT